MTKDTKKPINLATTGLFVVMAACRRVSGELPVHPLLSAPAPSNSEVLPGHVPVVNRSRPKNVSAVLPNRSWEGSERPAGVLGELLVFPWEDITMVLVRDGR